MFIPLSLEGSSRSRSVMSSAELVIPLLDLVSLSKVLVVSLFTVSVRSRSAEILSAELVAVVSSPQRRTRKKKQLLTQIRDFASENSQGKRRISNLKNRIAVFNRSRVLVNAVFAVFDRDFGSRSVEFVIQPSVIDSACVGRSLAIQNSAMVCRLPSVNLYFACVNRSRRGEKPVLDSDFACVDCNRVSAEQQIEAEPIKEEPENPAGKSTKSKKVKAGLSQYAIQKFVEEKQKTLKNANKNLNSEFAKFVEGAALHESPKDAVDFSLIPEAVDDYQFGDSNEKFVFPFLPSSDKVGLYDLSFVSSGIASDIYSAGISSTYQCQNSSSNGIFVALIHLYGSKGIATRGLEILAAMENLKYDISQAWLILVEEFVQSNHLENANKFFLLKQNSKLYHKQVQEELCLVERRALLMDATMKVCAELQELNKQSSFLENQYT